MIEESHDDEVRSLLAGSIEQSVKTVLSAVAGTRGDSSGSSEFEEVYFPALFYQLNRFFAFFIRYNAVKMLKRKIPSNCFVNNCW